MALSAFVALQKAVASDLRAASWSIFVYFWITLAGCLIITAAEVLTKVSPPKAEFSKPTMETPLPRTDRPQISSPLPPPTCVVTPFGKICY
jgi:hypothetical protein